MYFQMHFKLCIKILYLKQDCAIIMSFNTCVEKLSKGNAVSLLTYKSLLKMAFLVICVTSLSYT